MEAATANAKVTTGTQSATVADLLPKAVEMFGTSTAVKFKDPAGSWVTRTYAEVGEVVRKLSLGLIDLGIGQRNRFGVGHHGFNRDLFAQFGQHAG